MAASAWALRHNVRSGRFNRSRHHSKEDEISFSINDDPSENIANILSTICQPTDLSDGKRLNYLNAFVKVTLKIEGDFEKLGFAIEDILHCLRISLVHESTQVRSGGLRAIRHVLRNEHDVIILNLLLIPYLVTRSLDLILKNDVERTEAMKLIRKILLLSPTHFDMSFARSLVSLANAGMEEKDRMLRICLATLCELGVLNAALFIEAGGIAAITRNLLECQTPKIAESLCGVLLFLLDKPATRNQAAIDLNSFAAPYCDFHYRHGWKDKDKYVDEREFRFNCSSLAMLSILRSWPGILYFCNPANKSGLTAIVEVLYLNQLEVRKAILDLLYELLGLPQPEWTDELSVALSAVDPSELQASWRLNEDFIAAEGRAILPHLAKTTPSITDMHLAFLLYSFLESGLLGALVEVIATSDTFISVRATVLLGELLHLIQVILPPECCNISPALPSLLEYATQGIPQAVKAVNGLQQLQKLLRRRPASYSIYMDFILRSGGNVKCSKITKKARHRLRSFKSKLQQLVNIDGDDVIKETGVLLNKDAYTWNWNLIQIILKGESIKLDMGETSHRNFLKRLVDFYSPSRNRYSHMDLTTNKIGLAYTMSGIDLLNCLLTLENDDQSDHRLLRDLLNDIFSHISAITSGKSVHDCLFSPQHMNSTQCQTYFLFVGRLSANEIGLKILNQMDAFGKLEHLATTTNNDCYVKLIVSSLDYNCSASAQSRDLLKQVLKCPVESSRMYATQFLLVLMRAGTANFHDWGVKFLVNQLQDKSHAIYLSALNILHEACHVIECLETLIKLNPDLTNLGEKGSMLSIRLLSRSSGFNLLNNSSSNNYVVNLIKEWDEYFNYRYVKLVEVETSDALTLHQRDEDGKYVRRATTVRNSNRREIFLPPHLYGQLARHANGSSILVSHGSLETMLQCLENGICDTDEDVLKMKSSLWAVGHFASSVDGLLFVALHNGISTIIGLAESCAVYSIRATAYYALGLIATTKQGADELFKLGWFCTRHNRHVIWPIIEEEQWAIAGELPEDNSLRINCDIVPPSEKPFDFRFFDSGIKDIEESMDDVTSECFTAIDSVLLPPSGAHHYYQQQQQQQQKSLTLPANQNLSSAYHKRSLSESKTFEIIRSSYDSNNSSGRNKDRANSYKLTLEMAKRVRNNSTTESTTSGVSSCDSACGGRSVIYERQQILSPIPSSCSLSTMKQSGQKIRRHSESSRRISVQSGSNSDKSSQSLSSSVSNRLSHQDLVGYTTLRSLRKSPRYLEEPVYANDDAQPETISWDVLADFSALDSSFDENNKSFPSFSSMKRFSVSDHPDGQERLYMGIALPDDICNMFPRPEHMPQGTVATAVATLGDQQMWTAISSFEKLTTTEDSPVMPSTDGAGTSSLTTAEAAAEFKTASSAFSNAFWKHDCAACLLCFSSPDKEVEVLVKPTDGFDEYLTSYDQTCPDSMIKLEILRLIDQFSNPIWNRQVKQSLLHWKQRSPHIFQDVCLYSEICRMIAECAYRLSPRRMLHELFLDVNYQQLYKETEEVLKKIVQCSVSSRAAASDVKLQNRNATGDRSKSELRTESEKAATSEVESLSSGGDRCNLSLKLDEQVPSPSDTSDTRIRSPVNIQTLDSLKLAYKQNKFPIRKRNDTKIV